MKSSRLRQLTVLAVSFFMLHFNAWALDGPIRNWVKNRTAALQAELSLFQSFPNNKIDQSIFQLRVIELGLLKEGFDADAVYKLDLQINKIYAVELEVLSRFARYLTREPVIVWPNTELNLLSQVAGVSKTVDQLFERARQHPDSFTNLSETQYLEIGLALGVRSEIEKTLGLLTQTAQRRDLSVLEQVHVLLMAQPPFSLMRIADQEAQSLAQLQKVHEETTNLFLKTFEAGFGAGSRLANQSSLATIQISADRVSSGLRILNMPKFLRLSPDLQSKVLAMIDQVHADMRNTFRTSAIAAYKKGRALNAVCRGFSTGS